MNTECSQPKTCTTCAHRVGSFRFGVCALSGYHLTTERKYPSKCGVNFEGWVQKQPLLTRIRKCLYD